MPYLTSDHIDPGDTTSSTSDDALLTAVEALVLDALNVRDEAITLAHMGATRASTAHDSNLPVTTWARTVAVTTGTSVHSDILPGTEVSPGGTNVRLDPIAGARATLGDGDILRWHFHCRVEDLDDTPVPDEDYYVFYLSVTGTDANGTVTTTSLVADEFGIPASFSMNQAAQGAGTNAPLANAQIKEQRVGFSGVYIHRAADSVFSVGGGDVHIDRLRVFCYLQNAANSVTISQATLTAWVQKG